MVDDDTWVGLDGVKVCFDDERLVSDAGVALAATLAGRLGVEELIGETVLTRRAQGDGVDLRDAARRRQLR